MPFAPIILQHAVTVPNPIVILNSTQFQHTRHSALSMSLTCHNLDDPAQDVGGKSIGISITWMKSEWHLCQSIGEVFQVPETNGKHAKSLESLEANSLSTSIIKSCKTITNFLLWCLRLLECFINCHLWHQADRVKNLWPASHCPGPQLSPAWHSLFRWHHWAPRRSRNHMRVPKYEST